MNNRFKLYLNIDNKELHVFDTYTYSVYVMFDWVKNFDDFSNSNKIDIYENKIFYNFFKWFIDWYESRLLEGRAYDSEELDGFLFKNYILDKILKPIDINYLKIILDNDIIK